MTTIICSSLFAFLLHQMYKKFKKKLNTYIKRDELLRGDSCVFTVTIAANPLDLKTKQT